MKINYFKRVKPYVQGAIVVYALVITLFASCATIPQSTVDVSLKLNQQLTALKQSEISIINLYFDLRQQNIRDYMKNEWYPKKVNAYFKTESVKQVWNTIIESNDPNIRLEGMNAIAEIVQKQYIHKENEMLKVLNSERTALLENVTNEFDLAIRMNNAIMNNLSSYRDAKNQQKEILSQFVDVDKISEMVESTLVNVDKTISTMEKATDFVEDNEETINKVINKIK